MPILHINDIYTLYTIIYCINNPCPANYEPQGSLHQQQLNCLISYSTSPNKHATKSIHIIIWCMTTTRGVRGFRKKPEVFPIFVMANALLAANAVLKG